MLHRAHYRYTKEFFQSTQFTQTAVYFTPTRLLSANLVGQAFYSVQNGRGTVRTPPISIFN